jgi:predicted secreted protein
MSKQISYQSSQLQLSLWSETVTTSETTKSEVVKEIVRYTCSVEEFKAQQELENDLISGRGAWLYKQLERELAWERAQAKALDNIMAMRAEVNNKHYNF